MSETHELVASLDEPLYPCVAQFHNECPPQWNVHILLIEWSFTMTTEQTYKLARCMSISRAQNGMVPLQFVVMKINVTQGLWRSASKSARSCPQNFTKFNDGQPGNCMLLTHFILGPKRSVSKAQFRMVFYCRRARSRKPLSWTSIRGLGHQERPG